LSRLDAIVAACLAGRRRPLVDGRRFHQRFETVHESIATGQAVPALLNVQVCELLVGVELGIVQLPRLGGLVQAIGHSYAGLPRHCGPRREPAVGS
jgi:hypothetical protein